MCSNIEAEINQNQAAADADVKIEINNDNNINIGEIINSFASNTNEYDLVQWSEQGVSSRTIGDFENYLVEKQHGESFGP